MRDLFLGKPWHWLVLVLVAAVLWWAGDSRLHVTRFNLLITALLIGSFGLLYLLLRTTGAGETVTRDPLDEDPAD